MLARMLGIFVGAGVAAVAVVGCGQSRVEAYCSYGAVSEAQLQGCIENVTADEVDGYDTNAADYARGELDQCLEDSGPYCEPR
jgi:hypothetical protein